MATQLYLIRHGQSLGNLENRFLGHTDMDLTETGYLQAEYAARYFDNINIDAVYASDLKRAFNTAKAIADKKGLSVTPLKDLRELFAGRWETMLFEEIPKEYPKLWQDWQNANVCDLRAPDGESLSELFKRVYAALEKIAKNHSGQAVAIGLHATPIRLMQNYLSGKSLDRLFETPWVANASVTKLIFEGGEFSLAFANDCTHLGNLKTVFPSGV